MSEMTERSKNAMTLPATKEGKSKLASKQLLDKDAMPVKTGENIDERLQQDIEIEALAKKFDKQS